MFIIKLYQVADDFFRKKIILTCSRFLSIHQKSVLRFLSVKTVLKSHVNFYDCVCKKTMASDDVQFAIENLGPNRNYKIVTMATPVTKIKGFTTSFPE